MGNSNIKQHIETASKTGACQLSRMGLKELPPDLIRLTKNLRTLDVSHNKIQHLYPPNLGLFTMLRQLVVSDNQLHHLPDEEMKQLKKLECLSAEMNFLTSLPPVIASLANLRTVNLSKNLFQVFPEQLCCLKNLDAVDLSCNRITRFPANINELHAIELNLNQNQVSTLPEGLAECPRLKVLRLEENCLDITAFTPNIMKNSQVALFAIEGNVFDMKQFYNLTGYEEYMQRYTATKKKFN